MRQLIVLLLLVRVAHADEEGKCVMTCTDPQHCTTGCGDSSSSSSSSSDASDAQLQAAFAAEREHEKEIDEQNREREDAKKRVQQVRSFTQSGIDAYRRKDWRRAIELFDKALRRDPDNFVLKSNLAQAEHALADVAAQRERDIAAKKEAEKALALQRLRDAYASEQLALAKKLKPVNVPAPDKSAFSHATDLKLPEPTVEMPDARTLMQGVFELSVARAKNDLFDEAAGTLEHGTPTWAFVGEKMNEVTLATELIPKWLDDSVSGRMTPAEAANLDLKAVTFLFNTGSMPGHLAQQLVEVGSTGPFVLDQAKAAAEHGIIAVTGAAGERTLQVLHAADDLRKWVQQQ